MMGNFVATINTGEFALRVGLFWGTVYMVAWGLFMSPVDIPDSLRRVVYAALLPFACFLAPLVTVIYLGLMIEFWYLLAAPSVLVDAIACHAAAGAVDRIGDR